MQGYNWRLLTILSILPIFLLGVSAFFALDESPRWVLIARGEAEAKQLLRKIAIRNDAGGGRYLPTLDALQLRIVRAPDPPGLVPPLVACADCPCPPALCRPLPAVDWPSLCVSVLPALCYLYE